MTTESVRMVGGGGWRRGAWIIGLAAAAAAAVAAVLVVRAGRETSGGSAPTGCTSDDDCPAGRICAAGGCIILAPGENADIWKEDVARQIDAGPAWSPRQKVGVKLRPADVCPPASGAVEKPDMSRVTIVSQVNVIDIAAERLTLYQQILAKSEMWLDALRLWLPWFARPRPATLCASSDAERVALSSGRFRGRTAPYADVALRLAVPAGTVAGVAIEVEAEPPAPGPDGFSRVDLGLDPVFGEARAQTVVVLPLGSDVDAIEGPPPTVQRLLRGHVAYEWEHTGVPAEIGVRYRVRPGPDLPLDLGSLNP